MLNDGDVGSGGSLVEAALDDFMLEAVSFNQLIGDINVDGEVNILDVVLLVNVILDGEYSENYDINSDGEINVLDIVSLVNIVLS